jgi:hypothetical protein
MLTLTFGGEVRKPVTSQVTTAPADAGPRQSEPDSLEALNCTDAIQRDPLRRDEHASHRGGQGFKSPQLHPCSCRSEAIA